MPDHNAEYAATQQRMQIDNLRNRLAHLERQESTWLRRVQEATNALEKATKALDEERGNRIAEEKCAAKAVQDMNNAQRATVEREKQIVAMDAERERYVELEVEKRLVRAKAREAALAERLSLMLRFASKLATPGDLIVPVTVRKMAKAAIDADLAWESK